MKSDYDYEHLCKDCDSRAGLCASPLPEPGGAEKRSVKEEVRSGGKKACKSGKTFKIAFSHSASEAAIVKQVGHFYKRSLNDSVSALTPHSLLHLGRLVALDFRQATDPMTLQAAMQG